MRVMMRLGLVAVTLLMAPPALWAQATGQITGIVTDTHFKERNRQGRLLAFLAKAEVLDGKADRPLWGLGVDESAALEMTPRHPDPCGEVVDRHLSAVPPDRFDGREHPRV